MSQPPFTGKSDFDDLNRELAGISGNRAARFFDGDEGVGRDVKKKGRGQRKDMTALDLLMLDPVYVQSYHDAAAAIDGAQGLLNQKRTELAQSIEHLERVIDDVEDRTVKLDDGTAVFRDKNGQLVKTDGSALTAEEVAMLIDSDNAQSYETYRQAVDALHKARSRQDKYDTYQDRIDDARRRMDGAPDKDTLDDVKRDMDELKTELSEIYSPRTVFENASAQKAEVVIRNLDLEAEMPTR